MNGSDYCKCGKRSEDCVTSGEIGVCLHQQKPKEGPVGWQCGCGIYFSPYTSQCNCDPIATHFKRDEESVYGRKHEQFYNK